MEVLARVRSWLWGTPEPAPVQRSDGWENSFTGYGTWRDKLTYGQHVEGLRLSDPELASLFYSDDVAAKLVEKRPEESFRRGYKLSDLDLQKQGRDLGVDEKMQEAWTWGRLYGGSLLIIGAEEGRPWEPLREERVQGVRFLNVVDRRWSWVQKWYSDPLQPNYGEPEVYAICTAATPDTAQAEQVVYVHESRVIRFDGLQVDARKKQELAGWTYSVLQRPYDVMRAFATAFQAAGVLTADASQAVFKMKGLFEMIASGEKARLQTRMQLVDMSRSAARAVLLDAEGEEFTRIKTDFQGLPEMLDRFMMRLASSVDMPVTILMGRSPAGQNATGDADFKHWYDSVASQQRKILTPRLLKFYRILSAGKAKDLEIEWLPLDEPTDKERADVEKTRAETHAIYIDKGVLFAEEVALAEFGTSTNGQIEIDEKARKESLKAEIEMAHDPPAPAALPAPGQSPPQEPAIAPPVAQG